MSVNVDHQASRKQRQDRLTLVGPGTPMGNYMRSSGIRLPRSPNSTDEPVKAVKLLGEKLALFRAEDGTTVSSPSAARIAAPRWPAAMIEGDAIRCAYHGWKFDTNGQCLDTPAEPPRASSKNGIKIAAYPVQEMAGLLWAYLGP